MLKKGMRKHNSAPVDGGAVQNCLGGRQDDGVLHQSVHQGVLELVWRVLQIELVLSGLTSLHPPPQAEPAFQSETHIFWQTWGG